MVIDAGRIASKLLEDKITMAPFGPAGAFKVTIPTDEFPPLTVDGFKVKPTTEIGETVSVAVCVVPFKVAVIVACVTEVTPAVLTTKVAEEDPDATVTEAGTVATELPLASATNTPPDPAALFN